MGCGSRPPQLCTQVLGPGHSEAARTEEQCHDFLYGVMKKVSLLIALMEAEAKELESHLFKLSQHLVKISCMYD